MENNISKECETPVDAFSVRFKEMIDILDKATSEELKDYDGDDDFEDDDFEDDDWDDDDDDDDDDWEAYWEEKQQAFEDGIIDIHGRLIA